MGIAVLVVAAASWWLAAWPSSWGIEPTASLLLLAGGIALLTVGKFARDARTA